MEAVIAPNALLPHTQSKIKVILLPAILLGTKHSKTSLTDQLHRLTTSLYRPLYLRPKSPLITIWQLPKPTTFLNGPFEVGSVVGRFREVLLYTDGSVRIPRWGSVGGGGGWHTLTHNWPILFWELQFNNNLRWDIWWPKRVKCALIYWNSPVRWMHAIYDSPHPDIHSKDG